MIEDIFAENLIDEPDDIERVIEDGDELRRDSDKGSDDEDKKKDEEEKEKEKQKIRKKIGPRPLLNAERLKGPRGIATMEEFFSGIKLDGRKGKEEKDLDIIMKRLELWTHRLYPRGQFDDCLKKIEKLGTNKTVRNFVTRIRLGLEDGSGSDIVRDEPNSPPPVAPLDDPFDHLMSSASGPAVTSGNGSNMEMTSEQRDRMLQNRLIAEERRAARIKKAQELKERFKAQQALNSQTMNVKAPNVQTEGNIIQKQQHKEGEGTLCMEVDDNNVSTGINASNKGSGGADKANTNEEFVDIEIQQRRKEENIKTPYPLINVEKDVEIIEKSCDKDYLIQEIKITTDGLEQKERSSQEKVEGKSEINVVKNCLHEITTEQRERILQNKLIAEERRSARIKKAQELKKRFKAQLTSTSQILDVEAPKIQPQDNIIQKQQQKDGEEASCMEVDDNNDFIRIKTINKGDGGTDVDEESKQNEIHQRGKDETIKTSYPLIHVEKDLENIEKNCDKDDMIQETEK